VRVIINQSQPTTSKVMHFPPNIEKYYVQMVCKTACRVGKNTTV
jgi:hypothetical protein